MYYHFYNIAEAKAFLKENPTGRIVVWGYPHPDTKKIYYSIFIPKDVP
jgi:hypothetical protein